jgi:hypothetical protein
MPFNYSTCEQYAKAVRRGVFTLLHTTTEREDKPMTQSEIASVNRQFEEAAQGRS